MMHSMLAHAMTWNLYSGYTVGRVNEFVKIRRCYLFTFVTKNDRVLS